MYLSIGIKKVLINSEGLTKEEEEYNTTIERWMNDNLVVSDSVVIPFPSVKHEYYTGVRGRRTKKQTKLKVEDFHLTYFIKTRYSGLSESEVLNRLNNYFNVNAKYFILTIKELDEDYKYKDTYVNKYKVYIKDMVEVRQNMRTVLEIPLNLGVIDFYSGMENVMNSLSNDSESGILKVRDFVGNDKFLRCDEYSVSLKYPSGTGKVYLELDDSASSKIGTPRLNINKGISIESGYSFYFYSSDMFIGKLSPNLDVTILHGKFNKEDLYKMQNISIYRDTTVKFSSNATIHVQLFDCIYL